MECCFHLRLASNSNQMLRNRIDATHKIRTLRGMVHRRRNGQQEAEQVWALVLALVAALGLEKEMEADWDLLPGW